MECNGASGFFHEIASKATELPNRIKFLQLPDEITAMKIA
jgi:hypothetical protein